MSALFEVILDVEVYVFPVTNYRNVCGRMKHLESGWHFLPTKSPFMSQTGRGTYMPMVPLSFFSSYSLWAFLHAVSSAIETRLGASAILQCTSVNIYERIVIYELTWSALVVVDVYEGTAETRSTFLIGGKDVAVLILLCRMRWIVNWNETVLPMTNTWRSRRHLNW